MDTDIDLYNTCAKICKNVYIQLKELIIKNEKNNVLELCVLGNKIINTELQKVYKNCVKKGILYPVSISLNKCVGNYIHEDDNKEYNSIKTGDVVKIDLGVFIKDAHILFGETFINTLNEIENEEYKYIELLNELSNGILKHLKTENQNDDIKRYVESKCSELDCVPVENCISYQQLDGYQTPDSKTIVLNYQKYYDEDDRVILPNYCFEFEKGEIYNINLTIVKGETSDCKTKHDSHIYRFNDYYYNLRLKASREFLTQCKSENGNSAFFIKKWNINPKHRIGIKECYENGILEDYPIQYENNIVFTKKFTVLVTDKRGVLFK